MASLQTTTTLPPTTTWLPDYGSGEGSGEENQISGDGDYHFNGILQKLLEGWKGRTGRGAPRTLDPGALFKGCKMGYFGIQNGDFVCQEIVFLNLNGGQFHKEIS